MISAIKGDRVQKRSADPVAAISRAAALVARLRSQLAAAVVSLERATSELCGGGGDGERPSAVAASAPAIRRKPGPRPGSKAKTASPAAKRKYVRRASIAAAAVSPPPKAAPRGKQAPAFKPPAAGASPADVLLSDCLPRKFAASLAGNGVHTAQDLIDHGGANDDNLPALLGDAFNPRGAAMIGRLMRRFEASDDGRGVIAKPASKRGGYRGRRRSAEAPAAAPESVGASDEAKPP